MEARTSRTTRASKRKSAGTRLGADAWVDAALAAIGRAGLAAVAVEPLAAELGVTKGSFYWHFANRDALLVAALERWEAIATRAVIDAAERGGSPRERLELLLRIVIQPLPEDSIEAAIVFSGTDPLVGPIVERVTQQRIDYLVSVFRDLGFSRSVAARRAYTAYAAYLGMLQLEIDSPQRRSVRSARTFVDELVEMFSTGT